MGESAGIIGEYVVRLAGDCCGDLEGVLEIPREIIESLFGFVGPGGGNGECVQKVPEQKVDDFRSETFPADVFDDGEGVPCAREFARMCICKDLKIQCALVSDPVADDQIKDYVGIEKEADDLPYF